ncbi:hypothetical protein ACHAP5_011536 [Fusarium lateritium]
MQVETFSNLHNHGGLGVPKPLTPDNKESVQADDETQTSKELEAHGHEISLVSPPDSDHDVTLEWSVISTDGAVLQGHRHETCQIKQPGFWTTQLESSRPAELLFDMPRAAALSGKTDKEILNIDNGLWMQLQQFCHTKQISPFFVLLVAFRVAHYRMSGTGDAVITAWNAFDSERTLRTSLKCTNVMEFFRINIQDKDTFQDILNQVHAIKNEVENLVRSKSLPEQGANRLRRTGQDSSSNPLGRMLLKVHSNTELQDDNFNDAQPEHLSLPGASSFDIELHIYPRDACLKLEVTYTTDLFKPEIIKSLLSIFRQVLYQGINNYDIPVENLNLMTTQDYDVLSRMDLLSPQTTVYPRESTVVDIFRQQAKATPDLTAVKDTNSQLTYTELDKQSDIVTLWLRRQQLPLEALVGVFAPRSCQVIVAFIGILKAGLVYLPFDTTTPHDRMKNILSSIKGQTVILTGPADSVPSFGNDARLAKISDILESSSESSGPLEEPWTHENITPNSLAYIMFTSGSTGRPKGVMAEHRGIVRLVNGCNMAKHLPRQTVMAHLTSIAFDNSTWEIYAPLLTGGTVVCIDATTVLDCRAIADVFIRERIQSAMLTPALLKQYLIGCRDAIAVLEMMCIQGEKAIVEDMFLARQVSGGTVINAYGPTENTVTSSFFVLNDLNPCTNGVPIGSPISNSGVHVMDSEQRLVPLGVIGELVVTGDGIARGYHDPERNVNRFISITVNGCTFPAYRTGDYVRHRPTDGQLEFFGRIDEQVKIHGHRIELGEIEHVIRSHQYVSDAVVVVVQNESRDARLAAYLTLYEVRPGSIEESTLVETWLDHWDVKTYPPMNKIQLEDIGRDFIGWTSMHDGSDIPRDEMNQWLDETIDTILDGGAAGHILEIGTGSGMILFNLNRGLQSYVGIEPSGRAVDFISQAVPLMPEFEDKVTMHQGTAGDINQLNITNPPDIAILNSVIQYFPSQDYLLSVIQSLINIGANKIFLGDVRSYALHREFLAARALFIVGDSHASPDEFRRIMGDVERAESELLVDPAFFTNLAGRLPSIHHVEILPKRIHAVNELSCYRYNAVLHIRHDPTTTSAQPLDLDKAARINFKADNLDCQSLVHVLASLYESPMVVVESIPESKTSLERGVIELLDEFAQSAVATPDKRWLRGARQQASLRSSMSATDLVTLAQQTGWQIQLSWARHGTHNGGIDAVFYRSYPAPASSGRVKFRFPVQDQSRPYSALSSHPLRREVRRKVQDQLHRLLQDKLPSYMIPQSFTFLEKLPVNQNGKVDRKVIASYFQQKEVSQGQSDEPMSATESMMRGIWSGVLGINACTISKNNSFFNLGGDSIAAMMVVNESRKVGIKITVADIFRWPALDELARNTEIILDNQTRTIPPFALLGHGTDVASLIKQVSTYGVSPDAIEDIFPCTPLQEGLIFETLKRPGDYVRQAVIRLSEGISRSRLEGAWERVIRAKPILRTRVIQYGQLGLLQVVSNEQTDWIDPSGMGLQTYLDMDKHKSMGLGQPLSRYAILQGESGAPQWLVWSCHHALYDGWSLHLLQDALYKVYEEELTPIEAGPQFQSFIKYVKDINAEESSKYWQRVLLECQHSPFPALPATIEHPIADTIMRDSISIPSSGTDITTSILIRAAWGLVMGQMTNSHDVLYGMTLYGRNAPVAELDILAAPTISTVPIRVQIDKQQKCADFLAKLQAEATEMIPYEQTGLQSIIKSLGSSQDSCKFQTQLVIQTGQDHCNKCPFGEWQQGSEE